MAEKYYTTAERLGQLLNQDKDTMLIVRMGGVSMQKYALAELSVLYTELGETEKLQNVQTQINQLESRVSEIKKGLSGP